MRKLAVIAVSLFVLLLNGCHGILTKNTEVLTGNKPPKVIIEIDAETYKTVLGSYCWSSNGEGECVDTVGPEELLKDTEPIQVQAGEKMIVKMDYTPKPNEIHLSREEDGKETEVKINDGQFKVPNEKGIYFYEYSVWWKDEEEENVSHGSASYMFSLEVK